MKCNIDARGKAARLIFGIVLVLVAVVLLLIGSGETWSIIAGISCLAGGGFTIFEGASGWCAVRAMGIKTKI